MAASARIAYHKHAQENVARVRRIHTAIRVHRTRTP